MTLNVWAKFVEQFRTENNNYDKFCQDTPYSKVVTIAILYISISKTVVEIRKKSVLDTQVLEFLKSLCLPKWTWLLLGEV